MRNVRAGPRTLCAGPTDLGSQPRRSQPLYVTPCPATPLLPVIGSQPFCRCGGGEQSRWPLYDFARTRSPPHSSTIGLCRRRATTPDASVSRPELHALLRAPFTPPVYSPPPLGRLLRRDTERAHPFPLSLFPRACNSGSVTTCSPSRAEPEGPLLLSFGASSGRVHWSVSPSAQQVHEVAEKVRNHDVIIYPPRGADSSKTTKTCVNPSDSIAPTFSMVAQAYASIFISPKSRLTPTLLGTWGC